MTPTKPVLVASDIHLGAAPAHQERAFMNWLGHAGEAASWIILNGDLFDFWFEYRWGTTRGYDEVLRTLRDIVDSGVPVTLMGGNHDWWGGSYLREEIGLEFLQEPITRDVAGHRTFLAHGDGLGRGELGYHVLRSVLRGRPTRWAFGMLPPAVGDGIARIVSATEGRGLPQGRELERAAALEEWAMTKLLSEPELTLVILGHTHLPVVREVEPGRWYANPGDWVFHRSYLTLERACEPRLVRWQQGTA